MVLGRYFGLGFFLFYDISLILKFLYVDYWDLIFEVFVVVQFLGNFVGVQGCFDFDDNT